MKKAIGTLVAGVALALSGAAFAQANNTLATPSTKSPVDTSSGYGTPGATTTESGSSWQNSGQSTGANAGSTSAMPAYGVNNTLATPSTTSPAGQ